MTDELTPRLKLIAKRDFDIVKFKYTIINTSDEKVIGEAKPLDVLALKVIPGSGLKVLSVQVLNEASPEVFLELLKKGAY